MKFSDITKVAKRFRYAVIVTDAGNNQWCLTGAAAYKLEGLPYLTADDFLNIIGIAEAKKCKWYLGDRQDEAGLFKIDRLGEQELTGDMAGVSILYNGHKLMPFYLAEGVVWLDVDLLAPVLNGKTEYLRFFLRNQNGRRTKRRSGIDCGDWGVPLRPRLIRTCEIDVAAMPDTGSGGGIS